MSHFPDIITLKTPPKLKEALQDIELFEAFCRHNDAFQLEKDLNTLHQKMEEWIANEGCRLGWLIDLKNQLTYIYQPHTPVTTNPYRAVRYCPVLNLY